MSIIKTPMPGRDLAGIGLASAAVFGGRYLWQKWQESKKMKNSPDSGTPTGLGVSPEEPCPFGRMQGSQARPIPLKSVSIEGQVQGLLFSFRIRQEYKNESAEAQEIIYTFPLAWNTALLGMDASIGGKRLHAEVIRKAEAEQCYEEAVEKGDAAIMLQQSSRGLYTANLGNIAPGESVAVEIHCARFLDYAQGQVRLCIPTVIGERYGNEHGPGGLAPHESARPDAEASYPFRLSLTLTGDAARLWECPTHELGVEQLENGLRLSLNPNARLDRDFVLLLKGLPGQSHGLCAPDEDRWLAAASFCPRMEQVDKNPLALKILVDCSGSMSGKSIAQAQKGLQKILSLLSPQDYVSYSRFGSDVEHMSKVMLECSEKNLQKLASKIRATEANMGGTEMEAAVISTVEKIGQGGDAPPALLLITDGDIWQVESLIESASKSGHRVFIIGVGAAPAESVLMDLARATGGVCEFVTPNENMAEAIVRTFHRMRGTSSGNIRIEWQDAPLWQSDLPPWIYDGETVRAFAIFAGRPQGGASLAWDCPDGSHSERIEGLEFAESPDLVRMGRQCQMKQRASDEEKLDIALKYGLVSDLTSAILVYERPEDEKLQGLPKIRQVPQMRAWEHGNYAALGANNLLASSFVASPCLLSGPLGSPFIRKRLTAPDNLEEILTNTDEQESGQLLARLAALWKSHVLRLASLADFMAVARQEADFAPVLAFLETLARESGLREESVWAAMLEQALAEAGGVDRHSLRLLKAHLPPAAEKEKLGRLARRC